MIGVALEDLHQEEENCIANDVEEEVLKLIDCPDVDGN